MEPSSPPATICPSSPLKLFELDLVIVPAFDGGVELLVAVVILALRLRRQGRGAVKRLRHFAEFQQSGAADQFQSRLGVFHAGKIDDHAVGALLLQRRLGQTVLIHSFFEHCAQTVKTVGRQRHVLGAAGLKHDMSAAAKVQPQIHFAAQNHDGRNCGDGRHENQPPTILSQHFYTSQKKSSLR